MKTLKYFKTGLLAVLFTVNIGLTATAQYTLTSDDVVVSDGIIQSCSYDFTITDIIIPEVLDGQTVTGIAGDGVFESKGITSIVLPATIQTIGDWAFYNNFINSLDLSGCTSLISIGEMAFYYNDLTSLDLSGCTSLTSIGDFGFSDNDLTSIDLSGFTSLISIGDAAFQSNNINSLDLSGCTSLISIGNYGFNLNDLTSIDLSGCTSLISIGDYGFSFNDLISIDLSGCTALAYIGDYAFYSISLTNFTLPINTEYASYGWQDGDGMEYSGGALVDDFSTFYFIPAPYTLTDEDVELTDGIIQSCSYDFTFRDIIIPETLDGQTVTGIADKSSADGVFQSKGITSIVLPISIQIIGDNAFYNNNINSLDLSECTSLTSIGDGGFSYNDLTSIDLSSCTSLISIEARAFYSNFLSDFNLPINSEYATYGWKDGNITAYSGGASVDDFETFYYIPAPYTLTDEDVELIDGIIQSCSYNFIFRDIIIPETLDGQTVTGIADKSYPDGVFMSKGITSIVLPATIETIGDNAFPSNYINSLTLGRCTSLISIGDSAFLSNSLYELDLDDCTALASIGDNTFNSNNLSDLDLSACTSLTSIGISAFNNNHLSSFNLPKPEIVAYNLSHWVDGNSITYASGNPVYTMTTGYSAIFTATGFTVNFVVIDEKTFAQGATVNLNGYGSATTNVNGLATFKKVMPEEDIGYTVTAKGYDEVSGTISVIDDDILETVTMSLTTYAVSFTIRDGNSPLQGASVTLAGYGTATTNAEGLATFSEVIPEKDIGYTVAATEYDDVTGAISVVDGDVNEAVVLTLTTYAVSFTISDGTTLVQGATVSLTGYGTATSDASGLATFSAIIPEEDIVYKVTNLGYDDVTGTISVVDRNVNETVALTLTTYAVSFTITDGTTPVQGATVSLTGYGTATSDASGLAIFSAIIPEEDITYTVTTAGYDEATGTISVVDGDVNEAVVLTLTTYAVRFTITDGTSSLQGASVTLAGYGTATTNAEGLAYFSEVLPEEDIAYTVTIADYDEATGTISVVDGDVNEAVALIITGLSNLGKNQLKLFPNPVRDLLHFQIAEDASVSIIDLSGKTVLLKKCTQGNTEIPVAHLQPGSYIFKVVLENNVLTEKIIVK